MIPFSRCDRRRFGAGRNTLVVPVMLAASILVSIRGHALAETKYFEERLPQCIACHGENGVSTTPDTPSLGGIDDYYALIQLVAFRERNRKNEIMNAMVTDMTDDDLRAAAAWVADQPRPPAPEETGDPDRMARGKALISANRCNACHGKELLGGHQMPPLRHQREDYLLNALNDYKAERRFGDRAAMVEVTQNLSDRDLADLAHYLAHMP